MKRISNFKLLFKREKIHDSIRDTCHFMQGVGIIYVIN